MSKKTLGRGLLALMDDHYSLDGMISQQSKGEISPIDSSAEMLEFIHIHEIRPGKFQPRTRFSEEELNNLVESIKTRGIIQPVIIRMKEGETKYELIAGERRWRAANIASLDKIPALIKNISDKEALELALIENIQRVELSPSEEAEGYKRLIDEFDYTHQELSGVVGKSRSHITNSLRLLTLPEVLLRMIEDGNISKSHARALITAEDPVAAANQIVEMNMTVKELANIGPNSKKKIRKFKSEHKITEAVTAEKGLLEEDIELLEKSIGENLGVKVKITNYGSNGQVIINYNKLEELDGIFQKLSN